LDRGGTYDIYAFLSIDFDVGAKEETIDVNKASSINFSSATTTVKYSDITKVATLVL
jgi:hypothetical protein